MTQSQKAPPRQKHVVHEGWLVCHTGTGPHRSLRQGYPPMIWPHDLRNLMPSQCSEITPSTPGNSSYGETHKTTILCITSCVTVSTDCGEGNDGLHSQPHLIYPWEFRALVLCQHGKRGLYGHHSFLRAQGHVMILDIFG